MRQTNETLATEVVRQAEKQKNRWKAAFFGMSAVAVALLIALIKK